MACLSVPEHHSAGFTSNSELALVISSDYDFPATAECSRTCNDRQTFGVWDLLQQQELYQITMQNAFFYYLNPAFLLSDQVFYVSSSIGASGFWAAGDEHDWNSIFDLGTSINSWQCTWDECKFALMQKVNDSFIVHTLWFA